MRNPYNPETEPASYQFFEENKINKIDTKARKVIWLDENNEDRVQVTRLPFGFDLQSGAANFFITIEEAKVFADFITKTL